MELLGGLTCSYNTFSCGDWLLRSILKNFLLTQWYVTINVMIAVAVTDTMKVTANVITATATVLSLSPPSLCPPSSPDPVNHVNTKGT